MEVVLVKNIGCCIATSFDQLNTKRFENFREKVFTYGNIRAATHYSLTKEIERVFSEQLKECE